MDIVVFVLKLAKNLIIKYKKLGQHAKEFVLVIKTIRGKANRSQTFLNRNSHRFDSNLRETLRNQLKTCQDTLREAKELVTKLESRRARVLKAIFSSKEVQNLHANLTARVSELNSTNQDITLDIIVKVQQRVEESRAEERFSRVSSDRIPTGTPPAVTSFLKRGGYIDKRDRETGRTALQDACEDPSQTRLLELLLRLGADPSLMTKGKLNNCVHLASYQNHVGTLKAIKRHLGAGTETVRRKRTGYAPAPVQGQVPRRESMIKESMVERRKINNEEWLTLLGAVNRDGSTPLHLAARGVCPEAVEFLVREIASKAVNVKDREDQTPLIVLAGVDRTGREEKVRRVGEALLKAGAKRKGHTAKKFLEELGLIETKDNEKPEKQKKKKEEGGRRRGVRGGGG
ncbi:hypothetical protein C8A00DRAFT_37633 [Chaetomidium leptoderma]|uniref:Uncharacterized protein n=1 Tax=Chaetomidium leptoderma TaxID=669021 RepID=A0AAN6VE49_9PEZI|nr:hypothetical protein C8A00DRAFT_37633 [Chaetomidium leptoderma]